MENEQFVGEINDNDLELELLKFSTIPLLDMTKDIQKILKFTKELLK